MNRREVRFEKPINQYSKSVESKRVNVDRILLHAPLASN